MSAVVALGPAVRVAGFALAGVSVLTTDEDGARVAWDRLPADTGLVLLAPEAAEDLTDRLARPGRLLWAVLPR